MKSWEEILGSAWQPRLAASEESIKRLQSCSPFPSVAEYVELLRWSNGGEGPVGDVYLSLWPAEEVPRLNDGYLIRQHMPAVWVIADDSSHFYAFDYTASVPEVIRFAVGFMHPTSIDARARSLKQMFEDLAAGRLF